MSHPQKGFRRFKERFQSRLSKRIVLLIFGSIVVIETILIIPSIAKRKQELLSQLKEVSDAKITWIMMSYSKDSDAKILAEVAQLDRMSSLILGGAVYKSNGQLVGTFGEPPKLSFSELESNKILRLQNNSRFDGVWSAAKMQSDYTIVIRHDASSVGPELLAYVGRIVGLVIIISAFITITVWIALEPLAIAPILQLRNDLLVAGVAIRNDEDPPEFYSASIKRKDELGDVIAAFRQMFKQITEAISDRKLAEAALQASLIQVETYSKALNKELEKGREIQKNFLPDQLLQIPDWEIAAFFQPARQVAGDFYDAFKFPNDNVGLVIADVCDKGVGAALFMALFRSMLRVFSSQTQLRGRASAILDANQPINGWIGESMSTNLAHLNALHAVCLTNDYVAEHHGDMGMFATLFFGVLDPTTGLLTYINGGHEPLFILNPSGGVREYLKSTGPAVGMLPDMKFKIAQTYLKPGEILFGYTDGVPEARNCNSEFFTSKRLLSMLESPVFSACSLIDRIAESVLSHTGKAEQFDDITMLAVQRASLK
jgi:sigma-B regulation protein RsbU (phosphoserine phosphatase)